MQNAVCQLFCYSSLDVAMEKPKSLDELPEEYFRSHRPPEALQKVLHAVLYTNPIARQNLLEARIRSLWHTQNPPYISANTGRITLGNGSLRIEIKNAGLRANLSLQRDAAMDRLNELIGERIVYNLLFL